MSYTVRPGSNSLRAGSRWFAASRSRTSGEVARQTRRGAPAPVSSSARLCRLVLAASRSCVILKHEPAGKLGFKLSVSWANRSCIVQCDLFSCFYDDLFLVKCIYYGVFLFCMAELLLQ